MLHNLSAFVFCFCLAAAAAALLVQGSTENERKGNGINTFTMKNKIYPLTSGAHASNLTKNYPYGNSSACDFGTLGEAKVKGRIVYCLGDSGPDSTIKGLKGVGTIMAVDPQLDYYMITLTPGATVARYKDGDKIDRYINSTNTSIGILMGDKKKYECSDFKKARGFDGLNYPSMHIQLGRKDTKISAVFYRTVTYVGYGNISGFKAKVTSPKELSVTVIPNMLRFTKQHQKQSFKVLVKGKSMKNGTDILSATLEWINFGYSVKSPILVYKQGAFF
ncbi:Peptidase S8, subtilisin-related protein [Corchorus capsularis]|uniref:Peptidase S8, subtilisin-related protein n=1 Tax=Corchorus capsularis TaxID=210143 RepID=A0A1R3IHS9_COCAP|nr:Peptidase S8, subtilisin-related protein [Corchorus capsularis]